MSQEQPQKPEGIKYADVFQVQGDLASKPIAPQDAAAAQTAEAMAFGQPQPAGPAAVMRAAATVNQQLGVVGQEDMTDVVRDQGAAVAASAVGCQGVVYEAVGGQVVGAYGLETVGQVQGDVLDEDLGPITVGEALEATALTAGDKPLDVSDAAAIQAAEVRATGLGHLVPGGVGAEAQSAAMRNLQIDKDEDKVRLGDVVADASDKLVHDKPVSREDAEGVIGAEIRNKPDLTPQPGGVAANIAAAARLNQDIGEDA